jgi:hypothetical protein
MRFVNVAVLLSLFAVALTAPTANMETGSLVVREAEPVPNPGGCGCKGCPMC